MYAHISKKIETIPFAIVNDVTPLYYYAYSKLDSPVVIVAVLARFSLLTVLFFSTIMGGSLEKSGGLIRAGSVLAFTGFGLPLQSGVVAFSSLRIFFLPTY